jgi:hypothetical protein
LRAAALLALGICTSLVSAGFLCTGCVSVAWERHCAFEPVCTEDVEALKVGESDINETLSKLGAPLYVWEGVGNAVVLAYGHQRNKEWGVRVSIPFDQTSVSGSYDDVAARIEGWVLVFGPDDKLKVSRAGLLRDLRSEGRAPPAFVE